MKKCLGILLSLLVAAALTTGISYAYFNATRLESTGQISTAITQETVLRVASFEELALACRSTEFNDSEEATPERIIIRFTGNITFTNNLYCNRDVHFDLGGYSLDLNGYELVIEHSYYGTAAFRNGTLLSSKTENEEVVRGKLILDTPYAALVKETSFTVDTTTCDVLDLSGEAYQEEREAYRIYSALYMVGQTFNSDFSKHPTRLTYAEAVAQKVFSDEDFVLTKSCSLSNKTEACSYIYSSDLDLPTHFMGTDVRIDYDFSDNTYISDYGKLLKTPTSSKSTVLTIRVKCGNTTKSCTFPVHIVNLKSNAEMRNKVGQDYFAAYMQDKYVSEERKIGEETVPGYYRLTASLELPESICSGRIKYTYFDDAGEELVPSNGVVCFEPTNVTHYLRVKVNNSSTLQQYPIYSTDLSVEDAVAQIILNKLYGGAIVYESVNPSLNLHGYDEIDSEMKETYKIIGLSYSLEAGSAAQTYYSLEKTGDNIDKLTIKPLGEGDQYPQKCGSVIAKFTFDGGTIVETPIYIVYIEGSGDNASGFIAYYNIYHETYVPDLVTSEFTMPFSYEGGAPYTCYEFAKEIETTTENEITHYKGLSLGTNALTTTLVFQDDAGVEQSWSFDSTQSIPQQLEGKTTEQISLAYLAEHNATWHFSVNAPGVTFDDLKLLMVYYYRFVSSDTFVKFDYISNDTHYQTNQTVSKLSVIGGLYYDAVGTEPNAIKDQKLFIWLYNNYKPSGDSIDESTDKSKLLIANTWLTTDVKLDVTSDATLNATTDWSGIENLTHTSYANFSGNSAIKDYLSKVMKMSCLETLDLSATGLSESDLDALSNLKDLSHLKKLYLNDNAITTFQFLMDFPSLEAVYLYQNQKSDASDTYYGSNGMCNYQIYEDLMRKGIAVYNAYSTAPMLYADNNKLDDYHRLKAIEYQSMLSSGVSIEHLYSRYTSMSPTADFNLSVFTDGLTWSYEMGKDTGSATYFYCVAKSGSYEMTVKFYVDRN